MYISEHATGLKLFETENHKRTNSDRRNIELSSIVKICMLLTHFTSVFSFYISHFLMFMTVQSLRSATMGEWLGVGYRIFVKKRYEKIRVGGFLFSVRVTRRFPFLYLMLFNGISVFWPCHYSKHEGCLKLQLWLCKTLFYNLLYILESYKSNSTRNC